MPRAEVLKEGFVEGDKPVAHISVVSKVDLAVICQAVMYLGP